MEKMNKKEFIVKLSESLSITEEESTKINEVLENNFFLSKKNKNKIINDLEIALGIDNDNAEKIYEVAMDIINKEIKYKLKHPFKSKK